MLILTEKDVESLVTFQEIIDINEQVFIKQSKKEVNCPNRIIIGLKDKGNSYFKPALVDDMAVGLKVVSSVPSNQDRGLPNTPATVMLLDPESGVVQCLISATYLTGLRTAAGSAIATKYMAREDTSVMVVFGSGIQADLHIRMILLVRSCIKTVYISSRTVEKVDVLIKELASLYKNVEFINSSAFNVKEVIGKADIIVGASSSKSPLFSGNDVKEGTHLCLVGTSLPDAREIDSVTMVRSKVIVDDYNSCIMAGDISIPIKEGLIDKSHILSELGDLLTGGINPRLLDSNCITLYKSSGTAIQDIATGSLLYQKALQSKTGQFIDMNGK
ncbi:hypothetical protein DLAC_06210 [Tieghemostelium lacteum]|uniref:Ornithine cyclodeaminase n=1 Tax=Tieghemostelium lacteum TaxID=361077 RepID=A0A151ZHQ1_TIELA|nr:hypothetical protein DLAC_06210 [Tieghemostelium lacteum]|eukprot:KYQ93512.1 hypothetical protein DLAC_06210 [Tieghemostelium lacteum]